MAMAQLTCGLILLTTLVTLTWGQSWTGDYLTLGQSCDPASGKKCFPGSTCDATLKICDCGDRVTPDGKWSRTYQDNQCRLLPGSMCVRGVDQDFYRCVKNSVCTQTRPGVDDPERCPADSACDTGDYHCICTPGKTCLTQKISVPKKEEHQSFIYLILSYFF